MALFKVDLTEQEVIQIIGSYISKTYNLGPKDVITVAWVGGPPSGMTITSQPLAERTYTPTFPED